MAREAELSSPEIEKAKRSWRIAALVCVGVTALNAVGVVHRGIEYYSQQAQEEDEDDSAATASEVSDIRVIKIEIPQSVEETRYSHEDIQDDIRDAGDHLQALTHNVVSAPENVPIHTIKITPDTLHTDAESGESIECFSADQLGEARAQYLENINQSPDSATAMIINQGRACDAFKGWAAWAHTGGDQINNTVYETFNKYVYLHEIGHVLKLGHAADISCSTAPAHVGSMAEMSQTDVNAILGKHCTAVQRLDDKQNKWVNDEYSDSDTVMGGVDPEYRYRMEQLLSFVEINKLAPEVAVNKTIAPEAGKYTLNILYGDAVPESVRMVTLDVPDQHPLHRIDEKIDKLSVGLNHVALNSGPSIEVKIIAHHKDQSYDLEYIYPFVLDLDSRNEPRELYRDSTLGVKILVAPNEDKNNKYSEYSVDVSIVPLDEEPTLQ